MILLKQAGRPAGYKMWVDSGQLTVDSYGVPSGRFKNRTINWCLNGFAELTIDNWQLTIDNCQLCAATLSFWKYCPHFWPQLLFFVLIGLTQQTDKLLFRLSGLVSWSSNWCLLHTLCRALTKPDNLYWCFSHWRGSALGFPRGEAVAKIGSSEPILVTDE